MSASMKVVQSSSLLLALQLVQRSLGIISTLVLARLLAPEDFGVIALVTIVLQFFELLVDTGNQQYIVQKTSVSSQDLNTAWSLDILIKSSIAVIVVLCSPLIAAYLDTKELTLALSVAALTLPIRALKTPGLMMLAKDINYRPLFRLTLWQKGLSFIAVMSCALIHASYWAFILGNLVSALVLAIGSYQVDSFRPHWSLNRAREQWSFSRWLLLRGMVGFTRSQIDNLIVSKLFGTGSLGGYNLVREVSLMPALSAIIPMTEPLLASIAQVKHDPESLAYRIRLSLAVLASLLVPVTAFIWSYPELIVGVLLGDKWQAYGPLLQPFSLLFFTFCLFSLVSDSVIALGRVKGLFLFDSLSTAIIIAVLLTFSTGSLSGLAWARGWLALATTLGLLLILNRWTAFGILRFLWLTTPAIAGSSLAIYLVMELDLSTLSRVTEFLIRGSTFVVLAALLTLAISTLLLGKTEEWKQLRALLPRWPSHQTQSKR